MNSRSPDPFFNRKHNLNIFRFKSNDNSEGSAKEKTDIYITQADNFLTNTTLLYAASANGKIYGDSELSELRLGVCDFQCCQTIILFRNRCQRESISDI